MPNEDEELKFNLTETVVALNSAAGKISDFTESFKSFPKDIADAISEKLTKWEGFNTFTNDIKEIKDTLKSSLGTKDLAEAIGSSLADSIDGIGDKEGPAALNVKSIEEAIEKSTEGFEIENLPDAYRLTGTERLDPVLILTAGLEKSVARMASGFTNFEMELEGEIQAIEDEAKRLAKAALGLSEKDKFEFSREDQAKLDKKTIDYEDARRNAWSQDWSQKLGGLFAVPIMKFAQYVIGFFATAGEQQKAALKFNETWAGAVEKAGASIGEIPGSISDKMGVLFDFQAQGMEQLGGATMALAGRMKLTGQNSGALINLNKKLIAQGGLSLTETSNLTDTLDRVANTFHVTTDLLVDSLGQLNESLGILFLGGAADEVINSITELTGMFPGLGDRISEFGDAFAMTDIGQAGILQSRDLLEKFTSGQIRSGEEFRDMVSRIAEGARQFTSGLEGNSVQVRRAMQQVIGPVGLAAMQLDDAMNTFVEKIPEQEDAFTKIFSSWKVAIDTMLAPFAETMTRIATSLQSFGETLLAVSNWFDKLTHGLINASNVLGIALMGVLVSKLRNVIFSLGAFGRGLRIRNRLMMRNMRNSILSMFAATSPVSKAMAGGVARMFAFLVGPFGLIAVIAWSLISWLSSRKDASGEAEAEKDTAKNTRDLVRLQRDADSVEFGMSRFERLTQKLIQDSLFSQATQESLLAHGLPQLIDAAERTADGVTTPTEVAVPIIVR